MFLSFAVVILLFVLAALILSFIVDLIAVGLLKKRYSANPAEKTMHRIDIYRRNRKGHIIAIGIVSIAILVCSFIGTRG